MGKDERLAKLHELRKNRREGSSALMNPRGIRLKIGGKKKGGKRARKNAGPRS